MPRKIFLDGDHNGNRPSPTVAAMIMMIPVIVFLIMKSKQSRRPYTETEVRGSSERSNRNRGREEENARAASEERAQQRQTAQSKPEDTEKKGAERQKDSEREAKQQEAKKANEIKAAANAAKMKERQDQENAYIANQKRKYEEEAAKHPDDPYLHQEDVPDSAYRNIRDKVFDPNKRPEKGAMMKRDAQGNKIGRRKSVDFGPAGEEPVGRHASFRKDSPGFVEHDSAWRPRGPETWNYNAFVHGGRSDRLVDKNAHSGGHPDHGPLIDPKTRAYFGDKTEQLKAHVGADHYIFANAMNAVFAQRGTPQYDEALQEDWHEKFGAWPVIACAPVDFIIGTLDDKHPQMVLAAVDAMLKSNGKYTQKKSTAAFTSSRLEIADTIPSKSLLVHGWFFDSFRLISTSERMNLSKGPPANAETEAGLGTIFYLFEWLEIFGVLCAKQRLLSPKGFDFPGLSMRLHCDPQDRAHLVWALQIKLFLRGGPERPQVSGKSLEGDGMVLKEGSWGMRLSAGLSNWTCVWSTLLSECASIGVIGSGFEAFETRQLIISPGYTVTGVNAAGGLKGGDTASFSAEQMQAVDEAQLRSVKPILNERDTAKDYAMNVEMLGALVSRFYGEMQPQQLMFLRHRQYNWCKASITATSNDYDPGDVAMWLHILGPCMMKHKQHSTPYSNGRNFIHLADLRDLTNLQHQENKVPLRRIDFGGTIPIEHDKVKQTRIFPSLVTHINLEEIVLPYVPFTRGADGTPAIQTDLPATALMVFASSLGLRPQIDARENLKIVVAVKEGEAERFEKELEEQVVMSMRQDVARNGKANTNTIANYNAKLTGWLGKIRTCGPDLQAKPVKTSVDWPADIRA